MLSGVNIAAATNDGVPKKEVGQVRRSEKSGKDEFVVKRFVGVNCSIKAYSSVLKATTYLVRKAGFMMFTESAV